jgi:hypothetical protein
MKLRLLSREFVFEDGRALAIPKDLRAAAELDYWASQTGADPLDTLSHNSIELKTIREPGYYFVIMGELTVRRAADGSAYSLPYFSANLRVSAEDLSRGTMVLVVPASGLFRVTVMDRDSRPIPNATLAFAGTMTSEGVPENGLQLFSQGIHAGADGSFLAIGNPAQWGILLDERTGLTIVPV